ncbi:Ketopantoate reductase PanE/ApbA [Vibrio xiamenensis]|uniref:Ketopantoate reductase PanE/ApbA n=1 Tax=Vibrio xiamenensis TaxID=861298 RepID=A0A1G8CT55_9VIBR|nr:Ketopantoate reductase PanE/ApbA [Vibrio xiamenensis]
METSSRLNIAMIGAGGISCYYGARLVSTRHLVVFVARTRAVVCSYDFFPTYGLNTTTI